MRNTEALSTKGAVARSVHQATWLEEPLSRKEVVMEKIRHFPYDLWHTAVVKAEIGGRRIPHDFRRTTARTYRRAGVSEGVIMQLAGWKTRAVFERYNIKNEKDLQEAAGKVGSTRELGPGIGAKASVPPISTK